MFISSPTHQRPRLLIPTSDIPPSSTSAVDAGTRRYPDLWGRDICQIYPSILYRLARSTISSLVNAALQLRFQDGSLPPWVEPFTDAVEALESLDQKDEKEIQKRRAAQRAGDVHRTKVGEVVVPAQSEEEEILEEIAMLERAVEELRYVSLIRLTSCHAADISDRRSKSATAESLYRIPGCPRCSQNSNDGPRHVKQHTILCTNDCARVTLRRTRTADSPATIVRTWSKQSASQIPISGVLARILLAPGVWAGGGGHGYGSLTRMHVENCTFDNTYRTTTPAVPDSVKEYTGIYQCDPLHRALRSADKLECLSVIPDGQTSASAMTPGIGTRKQLPLLHTAILPPPSVWSIDIDAPNLRTLHFVLTSQPRFDKYEFTQSSAAIDPLLPTIADSPASPGSLKKLEDLAFECNRQDDVARLEEWISQTENLTTLSLSGYGMPYPMKLATPENPDNRAQIRVLQLLVDHPEYVPRLKELKLEYCWVTEEQLINFVKRRMTLDGASALERLTLTGCSILFKDALEKLEHEVAHVQVVRGMPDVDTGGGEYEARHFRDSDCQSRYSHAWW